MEFRPCIDIHNGSVKQIVGGSLKDDGDFAKDNFVSEQDASFYAKLYKEYGLKGGHVIILNKADSDYYEADLHQAELAFKTFPEGLQVGGGVNADNAQDYLKLGASKVIVTSYVFKDGVVNYDNLEKIFSVTGKDRLVIDLSCRKKDDKYYIVTDRWQNFTNVELNLETLKLFTKYTNEFLVHAVDVEGKASGIEEEVVKMLGELAVANPGVEATYAGGVSSLADVELIKKLGNNKVNVTVGSALDIFGGNIIFHELCKVCE